MFICGIFDHPFMEHTCIIDQDIDLAELPADLLDRSYDLSAVADIGGEDGETCLIWLHFFHDGL